MVNAVKFGWKEMGLALAITSLLAGLVSVPANAQHINWSPVLENDAVEVVVSQWPANTARRIIARRPAQDLRWPVARAQALLAVVEGIGTEGLDPADYRPQQLRAAISTGAGWQLSNVAGEVFGWLVTDLRDGRTPMDARRNYLMDDPDAALLPIAKLMERALAGGDVAGVLASLNPRHGDYAALRSALAATPADDWSRRANIRANMDRWRWLPRDLGGINLLVNVPEFKLRLSVNGQVLRDYRTIVGTPGRNATPQMFEMIEGVILNPTWTVPQSIVVGEGLGRRVLNNPAWARSRGYTARRGANGFISVVQSPGSGNSLGEMKLDMPNAHAIFLHDTPNREMFSRDVRALSHGCIRTEDALELAITLAQLGRGASAQEAMQISESGSYTRVAFEQEVPVYIGYFTMGRDEHGNLVSFADIYGRDAPVLASFERPVQR